MLIRTVKFTKTAERSLTKLRKGNRIAREHVDATVKAFDISYPSYQGKTAIPFRFQKTDCYVLVQAESEDIFVITVSCSKQMANEVRHL